MKLIKASGKAMKYACLHFHYSKKMPLNNHGYSVFNDGGEWCGVIMFGRGASPSIGSPFGLKQGEYLELQRIALNGKQESTSKAVSIALKLIKKDCPLVQLIISYADGNQNHLGIIYQATNWVFTATVKSCDEFIDKLTGKNIHLRMVNQRGIFNSTDLAIGKRYKYEEVIRIKKKLPKYRYVYPLSKVCLSIIEGMRKPYPKSSAALPHKGEGQSIQIAGAFDSTMPLNNSYAKAE